jgi:Amt family ammonium transporter
LDPVLYISAAACLALGAGLGYVLAVRRRSAAPATEEGFRHLTEEVEDMIFRYDVAGGSFEYINSAAVKVTGYRAEEFVEHPNMLYQILVPDEEFQPRNLDELLIEGARKNPTIRIIRKDGDQAWIKMRNVLIRDRAGRVLTVEGILSDVTQESKARQSLQNSEETYRIFFSASNLATALVDEHGAIQKANDEFVSFCCDEKARDQSGVDFAEYLSGESAAKFKRYIALAMEKPEVVPRGFSADFQDKSGAIKPVYIFLSPAPEKKANVVNVLDLPELHVAKESLDLQKLYFSQLFRNSPLGIAFLDKDGKVVDINPGFEKLFGYELEEVRSWESRHFLVPEDMLDEGETILNSVLAGKTVEKETVRKCKNGRDIPLILHAFPLYVDDDIGGIFNIYQDISERKEYEEQLSHRALHDSLTGLPNRALFLDHVEQAMKRARENKDGVYAVIMFDLERFRMINETYGHLAGDEIIKQIPERLSGVISSTDTLARPTGDQFGAVLENREAKRDVLVKAAEIIKAVGKSYEIDGDEVHMACDVGVVFDIHDYDKAGDILRDAEIAVQQSKVEKEKTRIKVFKEGMHRQVADALSVENELRKALRDDQFEVYYQPIISLEDESVVGFEALLRWFHPELDEITPDRFIPVAERTGLILELGEKVLNSACGRLSEWQSALPDSNGLIMSVNVSPRQMDDRNIIGMIDGVLAETGVNPELLKLEITESLIMQDTRAAIEFFETLRSRGVRLAIDDFGTGYSSLGYLHRFPVDYLKVDKSFVSGEAATESATIIKSVVNLAENYGFKVIAEGAETRDQVEMLKRLGCHEAQGFYFAKPMKPEDAFEYLKPRIG